MSTKFIFPTDNSYNECIEPPLEPDDDWYDEHYPDEGTPTGFYKYNEETDEYEEIII